jgi:hypothetical protein
MAPLSKPLLKPQVPSFHGPGEDQLLKDFLKPKQEPPNLPKPPLAGAPLLGLDYRFYSHSHPCVADLIARLAKGSVKSLQAADTDYRAVAQLVRPAEVKREDGTTGSLAYQERISLPDGTPMELPGGIAIRVQGKEFRRIENGQSITISPDTAARLPLGTLVEAADGSMVSLSQDTEITLPDGRPRPAFYEELFSDSPYHPGSVQLPYPVRDLDFSVSGAYSVYNWELFYHVPLTAAIHLSKNQRFEEAMQWFHYVFDPTDDSDGPTPERFWKARPLQTTDVALIEEVLLNLSKPTDQALYDDTVESIRVWQEAPFRPHAVAAYRPTAYMFKAVMAYLDNLIAWGDNLFRQDTGESINEATQLYILAANILGPRPQAVPRKGTIAPQTYAELRPHLDEFRNALRKIEAEKPYDLAPEPGPVAARDRFGVLRSVGEALYFCVPRNDKLLAYWDTVADRLFKIRNSLSIRGIYRQLPLWEPPIDPALLVKAAAAGLDIGAIVSGLNQPLPLVRCQFLLQKAAEICQEVKSLGNGLLAAIEKEDSETLSQLRARHESLILGAAKTVKYAQWQEAIKAREAVLQTLTNAKQRYVYYARLLGETLEDVEKALPVQDDVDTVALDGFNFKQTEGGLTPRSADIAINVSTQLGEEAGGRVLTPFESEELRRLQDAQKSQSKAGFTDMLAIDLSKLPDFTLNVSPFGSGSSTSIGGGSTLSKSISFMASALRSTAGQVTYEAGNAAKIAAYDRREQEWSFQQNVAAGEINQILKQLRAAQIREALAEREWTNHQQQIKNAEEIEHFLKGDETPVGDRKHRKATTQDLYAWMKREVKGLYAQCFQFAFDVAKKAERALQHELGDPQASFLQFGYLTGREGLLAGERLYQDIKRMEMAYHDLNEREYELTKHVSVLQVDPYALLQLRETGRCAVVLPEELFDMDGPGHYFRRIRSVAVSIPCVTGPYTSVNCTVTLLKSSIRKSPVLRDGTYGRDVDSADDERFSDHFGSSQSIVTSSGQSDSGLFETNLRDERYLPFEGAGVVVSEWQLELPADVRQFNYDTISDVLLHIRYTAREGGALLRNAATANLNTAIAEARAPGCVQLFSVRHEFATEWAAFCAQTGDGGRFKLAVSLTDRHFPFWSHGRVASLEQVRLIARSSEATINVFTTAEDGNAIPLTKSGELGALLEGKLPDGVLPKKQNGKFGLDLWLGTKAVQDLWLAVTWRPAEA